ncbi:hypothetical protein PHSY_002303 [Pseudozyma hubeiensis SY62]|uniref:Amine oxidase domain-containing protein n=1 Tax=Pseudozyma hubeiensis (strain SY62) TaxID=1305764 RepID=R9P9G3_PSEHS|nr:hypothetical protein PHSY_002303 [Pseudozyma hubeiensis SY62]GAC94730.1 hypothetical protein PHSY_002303 [Pseudozyma hubeiensis SY62]
MSTLPGPPREVRVAIVGSGLTGLVATYLLTAPHASLQHVKVNVEIFERASTLGMDSASISVPLPLSPPPQPEAPQIEPVDPTGPHGDDDRRDESLLRSRKRLKLQTRPNNVADSTPRRSLRIDVPMRAFTGGYYPQLLALYRHLGIRTKPTNFTYSFATLPATLSLPASASASLSPPLTASSSATRSSTPDWQYTTQHKFTNQRSSSTCPLDAAERSTGSAPSPSVLYNGANGFRGASLPADLGRPRLSSPVKVSSILAHIDDLRKYFSTLLLLVFGYLQLLVVALWHHYLGHTCDPAHPLRSYTLRDLVADPFPARPSPPQKTSSLSLKARSLLFLERSAEHVLRRFVCLDERFAQQTLTPLFSAVMTSSLESVWGSPASEVLDYVALTLGKDHFVVRDGVRTVVASLLQHVDQSQPEVQSEPSKDGGSRVWTNAEVRHVGSQDGKVWIDAIHHPCATSPRQEMTPDMSRQPSSTSTDRTLCGDQDHLQRHGPFDHVIFATQANQTAQFLQQYVESLSATVEGVDKQERDKVVRLRDVIDVLSTFKYERSVVVNHTDRALLPRHKADWRDLNLVSPTQPTERRKDGDSEWIDEEQTLDGNSSQDTLLSNSCPTKPRSKTGSTMATHVLTLPPDAAAQQDLLVMQTTNPLPSLHPHPSTILSSSTFERAVIDVEAHLARQSLFHLSQATRTKQGVSVETAGGRKLSLGTLQQHKRGERKRDEARVWVCGSWAVGIPLLEGCVVSARLVAEEIMRGEGVQVDVRW